MSEATVATTPKTTTTAVTATNNHTIEKRLVTAQAIAGSVFFIFLLLHLSNALLAPLGADVYNSYQQTLQQFYQHPLVEPLLVLLPIVVHAIAGIWLYIIRRKRNIQLTLPQKIHRWAGVFLLLVIFEHVLATRGISFFFDAVPGFAGVSFSLWWMPAYFYPYYFLLFMAGSYHGIHGLLKVINRSRKGSKPITIPAYFWLIPALGVTLSLLSFGGHLNPIADPRDNDYARVYAELMDVDLTKHWEP